MYSGDWRKVLSASLHVQLRRQVTRQLAAIISVYAQASTLSSNLPAQ